MRIDAADDDVDELLNGKSTDDAEDSKISDGLGGRAWTGAV